MGKELIDLLFEQGSAGAVVMGGEGRKGERRGKGSGGVSFERSYFLTTREIDCSCLTYNGGFI